jgi:hypothetical protein
MMLPPASSPQPNAQPADFSGQLLVSTTCMNILLIIKSKWLTYFFNLPTPPPTHPLNPIFHQLY